MSSQHQGHTISPPPVPASPPSTGVRRHHTISASSRRSGPRAAISEEDQDQEHWNDDEVVDEDWVGGVGVVGEKSSLHRQSSLPTRYHRGKIFSVSRFALSPLLITSDQFLHPISVVSAFQSQQSRQTGNLTPRTMNSLSTIAGHEGDEEDWEREMRGLHNEEEV
jgi:YTH domain-containing family protein